MRFLETDTLLIRPVQIEDIEQLLEFRWDSDVMALALHEPISMQQQEKWFHSIPATDLPMSIFLKRDNELKLIGTVGLYQINMRHQRAVLRIRICKEMLGKGYGYKAMKLVIDYGFSVLNIRKITSDCFSENSSTIKIKTKLGFIKEGVLRQHYFHNGAFKDADVYGLLKDDFYNAVKG
jgi:RimJ/RimL family protein N-acetyltransferase